MARHQQCDMVGRTRARHCTHGLRLADRRRNFGIRAHFAVRNRLQIFPDFKLERGAARVQRQIELRLKVVEVAARHHIAVNAHEPVKDRSEEHTSELQSLMRTSYAVFCLKKKNTSKK